MRDDTAHKCISAGALDALLAAHDGDMALLYLYLLRTPEADPEQAARDLCRTLGDLAAAEEKLRRLGLLPAGGAPAVSPRAAPVPEAPAEELPQYSAAELSARGRRDPAFSAILDEAAKVMGRALGGNDLRTLFGVYDHLGLPAEVILELLNYVGQVYRDKYGESRRPTARAIEKEAFTWANRELLTLEQAEAYIHAQRRRWGELGRIQALLGLHGRPLSATEQKYIGSWLDLGFGEEAIAMAHDRTVTNTGGLKWPYMNSILLRWHEKGLHDPAEIEAKDGRGRRPAPAAKNGDKPVDLRRLRDTIDKI